MKKIFLKVLHKTGAFLKWKWLTLVAGAALIGGTQSCELVSPMCYDPVEPIDTTTTSDDRPIEEESEIIPIDTTRTQE